MKKILQQFKNSFILALMSVLIFPSVPLQQAQAATVGTTGVGKNTTVTTVLLTTQGTNSWTVPANWNSSNNTVDVYGGGAGGGSVNVGGGGGGWAQSTNISLTPGSTVTYGVGQVGTPVADGGNTWFNAANFAACVSAAVCASASGGLTGNNGGTAGAGTVGVSVHTGGAGDASGGGGAAGPISNGADGAAGGAGGGGYAGAGGPVGACDTNGTQGVAYGGGGGQGGPDCGGGGGTAAAGNVGLIVITYTPAAPAYSASPSLAAGGGLVSYWPFGGAITNWSTGKTSDTSGQGNTAQLIGFSTSSAMSTGPIGQALKFNGSTSYAQANSQLYDVVSDWSISAWVNPSSLGQLSSAVYNGDDNSGYGFGMGNGAGSAGSVLTVRYGGVGWISSGYTFTKNKWVHVVLAHDSSTLYIYVNGVLQNTSATGVGTPLYPYLSVGMEPDVSDVASRFWKGSVDEVRLYNKALSYGEVQRLYSVGKAAQGSVYKKIFLTKTGTNSWTVPADWNNTANIVEVIGAGASGGNDGSAGGGGGYSKTTNLLLVPGSSVTYGVGAGGSGNFAAGGNTWFNAANFAACASASSCTSAQGGQTDNGACGGTNLGGAAASGIGTTKYSGGNGGACNGNGSGGGGAAGLRGDGVNGTTANPGNGGAGDAGYGGAGGAAGNPAVVGSNGSEWSYLGQTVGSGGGGGGNSHSGSNGANGGLYGGGGGGSPAATAGTGGQGLIVISYAPTSTLPNFLPRQTKAGRVATSTVSNGLIGYWSLNGNTVNWATGRVTDSSGQGNTGQLISMSTSTSPAAGKVGQALKFNGGNQYIDNGSMSVLDGLSALSYSVWVKRSGTTGFDGIMSRYDGTNSIDLVINGPADLLARVTNDQNTGNYGSTSGGPITLNVWHHIVMVYDGTQSTNATKLKVYVDGVQKTLGFVGTINSAAPTVTHNLFIGQYPGTLGGGASDDFFNGSIDEVRIYNRALTNNEVNTLYRAGK